MIGVREIMARAVANQSLMDGTIVPVRTVIDHANITFAVWPDAGEPDGGGFLIIKGQHRLKVIAASGDPAPPGAMRLPRLSAEMVWDAILCDCPERAEALRRVLGEADDD